MQLQAISQKFFKKCLYVYYQAASKIYMKIKVPKRSKFDSMILAYIHTYAHIQGDKYRNMCVPIEKKMKSRNLYKNVSINFTNVN